MHECTLNTRSFKKKLSSLLRLDKKLGIWLIIFFVLIISGISAPLIV